MLTEIASAHFASEITFIVLYMLSRIRTNGDRRMKEYEDYTFLNPAILLNLVMVVGAIGAISIEASGRYSFKKSKEEKVNPQRERRFVAYSVFLTTVFTVCRYWTYLMSSGTEEEHDALRLEEYTVPVFYLPLLSAAAIVVVTTHLNADEEEEEVPILKLPLLRSQLQPDA